MERPLGQAVQSPVHHCKRCILTVRWISVISLGCLGNSERPENIDSQVDIRIGEAMRNNSDLINNFCNYLMCSFL